MTQKPEKVSIVGETKKTLISEVVKYPLPAVLSLLGAWLLTFVPFLRKFVLAPIPVWVFIAFSVCAFCVLWIYTRTARLGAAELVRANKELSHYRIDFVPIERYGYRWHVSGSIRQNLFSARLPPNLSAMIEGPFCLWCSYSLLRRSSVISITDETLRRMHPGRDFSADLIENPCSHCGYFRERLPDMPEDIDDLKASVYLEAHREALGGSPRTGST